jgi:hypothetical protein
MDWAARTWVAEAASPSGALGLCATADGHNVLVAGGARPALLVIDTREDQVVDTVELEGYNHAFACAPWVEL